MSIGANFGFSLLNTTNSLNAAQGIQNVNQARLGLANSATENMTFGQIADLAAQDKALTLQGAQNQTNYLATTTMEGASRSMMKQYWEGRRQAIQNGYLF